jgi:hypothetical protein
MQISTTNMESSVEGSQKLKIELWYNPAAPLLGFVKEC